MRIQFFHSSILSNLFFVSVLLLSITRFYGCAAANESCTELFYNCGSLKRIGYPFWGGDQPQSCGIRPFQLQCEDNQNIILTIGDIFIVLRIEESSSKMIIARYDLWTDICLKRFTNISWLNFELFTKSQPSYLIISYGCSFKEGKAVPSIAQVQSNITCPVNDMTMSAVGFSANNFSKIQGCNLSIVAPVEERAYNELLNGKIGLTEAFKMGFTLDYEDLITACQTNSDIYYCPSLTSTGTNASYISTARNETKDLPWYEFCDEKVETTVMEMGVGLTDDWVNRFGEAINGGFVLDWRTTKTCAKCENSGGYCGKNNESGLFVCFCTDGSLTFDHCNKGKPSWRTLVSGATVGAVIIFACSIIWHCKFRECSNGSISLFSDRTVHDMNLDIMEQYGSFSPKRYSYFDIKKMTKCFKEKIGQGGYGEVYKGYISESCPVAVKILNTSKGNGEEFINEVSSISRTSHFNVITLLGFCMDRSRRALIYEFLPNGSLEKYISQEAEIQLGIEKLYDISIGTARGLEYLHKGCNTRILHFDIKPHNILLDEDFCPKISDFGLAKLCARKDSIVSMLGARGTIGYIAPEVFSRNFGVVSYKSDVYSYGMMILEMVGGRRNAINGQMTNSSEAYFPHWAYKHVILKEDIKMIKDRVMTEDENKIARKMIIVGLWCIQTDPSQRPTMSKVIEMLEGDLKEMELNPPKPFLYSPSRSGTTSLVTTILPLQNMQTSHSASAEASYKSNECY